MKRWFHKEDGGLMVYKSDKEVKKWGGVYFLSCSICGEPCYFTDDVVHFSELPENLQTAALAEML